LAPSILTVLLCLGIVLNLLMATPHLLHRQDLITRNTELTAVLARMPEVKAGESIFLKGHSWDAEVLAVYANGYRRLGIDFVIADPVYAGERERRTGAYCEDGPRSCLSYSPQPTDGQLVVDLGVLESMRSAIVIKDSAVLWRYEDEKLEDFLALTPRMTHGLLRHFYNFW
jgi:hypothetical protein